MIIVQHSKIFITTLQPLDILRLHSIPGTEKKNPILKTNITRDFPSTFLPLRYHRIF